MTEPAAPPSAPRPHSTPWPRAATLGILFSVIVCVVVVAFSWPSATLDPQDVPVAISGPATVLQTVEDAVDEQSDGAISLIEVADRDAAVESIETREAYGAIILGDTPEVLTSSAASTATNQLMTQLQATMQTMLRQQATAAAMAAGATAPTVTVALTDVVPLVSGDPRGAGLTSAALPLVFGGMIGGMLVTFLVNGAWRRVTALLIYAVVSGAAIAGIMQGWFQVLGGNYFAVAGAFSLALLSMGATIVGFASLFGRAGVAVGPVLFMLIGNPISGTSFPKEFYPKPWGEIGQYLPPGAGGTLLKDVSYFPDADLARPILTLAIWAAAGLALVVIGHFRNQSEVPTAEEIQETAATATA